MLRTKDSALHVPQAQACCGPFHSRPATRMRPVSTATTNPANAASILPRANRSLLGGIARKVAIVADIHTDAPDNDRQFFRKLPIAVASVFGMCSANRDLALKGLYLPADSKRHRLGRRFHPGLSRNKQVSSRCQFPFRWAAEHWKRLKLGRPPELQKLRLVQDLPAAHVLLVDRVNAARNDPAHSGTAVPAILLLAGEIQLEFSEHRVSAFGIRLVRSQPRHEPNIVQAFIIRRRRPVLSVRPIPTTYEARTVLS